MRCSSCGSENPSDRKFCGECGAQFLLRCPKCGKENVPPFRYCGECGTALAYSVMARAEEDKPITATVGERRHLTVLFCDLVGSTEIAARLDPEEWREMVGAYHRAAAEAITRYGGHVAQYLGDGVMAYFGWPEAHENDAERAARAGLAILEAVSKPNQKPTNPKISTRVGIDSGAVVVGAGAGKDADVFGETPNIAARVQTAAAPDSVLITGATRRLLSDLFLLEERGALELKGVANPVELYRVLRPSGVRGRLAAARGLTRFVGREEELRLLLSRWERAREGEGQLMLVAGEAGIGKSRLVAEFHDRIRDTPHIWMESAGEQFFQNSPFHVINEILSQWLELQGAMNRDERIERLERAMASAGLKPENAAPQIADLLQLPVDERYPAIALTPEQRRRRLLAALAGWVFGAAGFQPVVMVVEDLHWLDPSTLELVQLLAEQDVRVPLMLLYTARPEFRAQWPMRAHHAQITLNRLSARNVREMIALVAARNALGSESVEAVIERTGGVPLFVEELTRAVLESEQAQLSPRAIPVTLHDSLMARLDRLGSAKSLLQLGSVIGSEFSYEVLRAVHSGSESELASELRKLTDADLLYFRGTPPDATYQFKHTLIRDAAYEALLKSRRKDLHRLVAQAIDEKFPALKETKPEILARHWTEAGETSRATVEWTRAGRTAEARHSFGEALTSYRHALQLLNLLRKSPDLARREADLSESVVRMLWITKGYSAAETIEATCARCLAGRRE
jgi:class 3 adenylate cyclase